MIRDNVNISQVNTELPPLVILTGPTAAGKTDLSIALAKAIDGEIISADSMQVYRKMDIGTAKISPQEMQGVKHHLIDVFDADHAFNVSEFQFLARQACKDILGRGHIPIVVGGTGFYIQALLYGINFKNEEDDGTRVALEAEALQENGPAILFERLKSIDPDSAAEIHPNNVKKVIRALEYYHFHQEPISKHNKEERKKESIYNAAYFVLNMDRAKLYERINKRVDIMMEKGLVQEVKELLAEGLPRESISLEGIGYKEILPVLDGKCTAQEAADNIKENTRHFAKRQLTWFRRERDVIWIDKDQYENEDLLLQDMLALLKNRHIINTK